MALLFIITTVLCCWFLCEATGKNKAVILVSFILLAVTGILAYADFFKNITAVPPRFLLVPLLATIAIIILYRKSRNTALSKNYLIAIHTLRLPVEMVLYNLYLAKQLPVIMTFEGWNFDIIMGVTAILILVYQLITKRVPSRIFMLIWNCCGLVLLTIIVTIAVLAAPLPFQQLAFNQSNIAVLQFPFTWLPGYVVPVVFLSHVMFINILIKEKNIQSSK